MEKKPEDKVWIVVAGNKIKEINQSAVRLKKFDLFKVGRVRFRVREIVTPFYAQENRTNDEISQKYKARYPM